MKKLKEKMPPSKAKTKPGKKVEGIKYAQALESYEEKEEYLASRSKGKPDGIAQALQKAKEGYSKKPRVKADKMKGK